MGVTIDSLAKTGGSLRAFLKGQGVTDEKALRGHITFILDTEQRTGRRLCLSRYRVHSDDPNKIPALMG